MGKLNGKTELVTLEDFTAKFFEQLKHGQILGFKQADGTTKHWRVSKIWHNKKQAWLQPWELFDNINEVESGRRRDKLRD